ncbi:MAG: outer membrane lipoprotein-sorting protein [Planctomycetota bacterium]
MRRIIRTTTILLALTLLAGPPALAQENGDQKDEQQQLTADQIVEKANRVAYYQAGTGRADVKMTIYNAKGEVRGERQLVILRRNVEGGLDQKYYAYFQRPADVRGTVFLVWKHTEKDDDRWLYNPSLDLVNRIAAADKRTSFVGTHFFYEDVSGRNIADDQHELRRTTDHYYVLRHTPKNTDRVEFAYYDTYIHRETFMPLYTYYYDENGEKYREYRVLKMEKIDSYWTATRASMIDYREKGPEDAHTVAEYSDVEYGIELPDDIFTERYLRRPPREYLQ